MRRIFGVVPVRLIFKIILAAVIILFALYLAFHFVGFALWLVYSYNFLTAVD